MEEADYVVMESTYGNRVHDTPPDYAVELAKVMNATFTKGKSCDPGIFSRTYTGNALLYAAHKTEDLLPEYRNFEVYIDSPLAVEATNIFHENVSGLLR